MGYTENSVVDTNAMTISENFSKRELEIIALMCDNYTSQEIADKLFLSKRTIDFHKAALMKKFAAKNSATLIKRIIELEHKVTFTTRLSL